ncbi:HDOD domain-containing protein [Candidatus Endoriftia persephone]|uniref:Metal dependent phosphohydrolase n=4 Tax=Gammaproteobacteria TaxID=1236 RepID=G2FD05_9GAMM|nr:metal dependent phosphohydrolase [endosymbiont of Tevnia jerichonana (vent Tica)]USF88895.1 HDOD domain-containing protein [Candidatus Endoriftia persephone]
MMADSSRYSALDIGNVIMQDANLSARLLRLVNSAFFGLQAPVETISRAVTIIGTKELRNLVLATSAVEVFRGIPADLVDMVEFWRYSLTTGVIARELAERCNVLHGERLFVMGVLHDVGRLVIYLKAADKARDILLITAGSDELLPQAESGVLGFTHMDVGAALLKRWKLPESIVATVQFHHHPMETPEYRLETALVHIASRLAYAELMGEFLDGVIDNIHPEVWEITGLMDDEVLTMMEQVPVQVAEVMEVVLAPMQPSSSLPSARS